jgi:hypothetical protein
MREIVDLPKRGRPIMNWLHEAAYLLGGGFLTNTIPHFVSGMQGRPFQTPFSKPPAVGLSSSTLNVLWGL